MNKTIRVTISVDLADDFLELFRENLEAGYEFHSDTIDEYDKFQESVTIAKRKLSRKRILAEYLGGKVSGNE